MSNYAITQAHSAALRPIVEMVLNSLVSANTRRSYERSLYDFLTWYENRGRPGISKMVIQEYRAQLQAAGLANASINLRLAAIRKLIVEATDNGDLDPSQAASALKARGLPQRGTRAGFWMTPSQAQALLLAPDITTPKGARDQALLAVLLGSGLRRDEIANLTVEHIQQREGRWVLVDIIGKGSKTRSVPVPGWTVEAVRRWLEMAAITTGPIFVSLNRHDVTTGTRRAMSNQAVYLLAAHYGRRVGLTLATHDLRRTFAKLSYKGGAPIPQISQSLGHASLTTTQRYLGIDQSFELGSAPCDFLGIGL